MTRYKLEIEQEEEFQIIAICCHEKDYRLCWKLNKACRLGLERVEPGELNPEVNSLYSYYADEDQTCYTLIANRNDDGWLMPEHKQVDYFFTLCDPQQKPIKEVVEKIRKIKNVLAVYEMEIEDHKSREKLAIA